MPCWKIQHLKFDWFSQLETSIYFRDPIEHMTRTWDGRLQEENVILRKRSEEGHLRDVFFILFSIEKPREFPWIWRSIFLTGPHKCEPWPRNWRSNWKSKKILYIYIIYIIYIYIINIIYNIYIILLYYIYYILYIIYICVYIYTCIIIYIYTYIYIRH